MASPFQQQVRQRKILYIALILVLFTLSWVWRRNVIDSQAEQLAIREESRGEVELTGSVVRLGLLGSRGVATCFLWNAAIEKQKKNQWNELEVLVRSLTRLQPYFITPWLFQSWNLSYNVSVESDRVRDKYFYVTRGLELLAQGERQNRNHPDLRWSIGFYMQHKICLSDETNYQRSLFQLSLIPPNERDPARFWKQTEQGPELNWAEFHKFCQEHPQLIRRLRQGMHRETAQARKQQFTCESPRDVVQFLDDNYSIPGLYRFTTPAVGVPAEARGWNPQKKDELLTLSERFPVLPPPHSGAFDKTALTNESRLGDDVDAYGASHSWFCYSQEPIPAPGAMPGSTQEITDRARQRKPKHMTTLIFRSYPAQGRRYMAERLQQEGWFDAEPWNITDWFARANDPSLAGKEVKIGGGREWSRDAWRRAYQAWREHGEVNHLIFKSESEEENTRQLARRFAKRYRMQEYANPPRLRTDRLSPQEKEEYEAALWMYNWNFYRNVSNFAHHYNRSFVEKEEATVACRKLFFQAEQLHLAGDTKPALDLYRTPIELKAWGGKKLSPLEAWRDLVLFKNRDFRHDSFNQEHTAEVQLRYLVLYNRFDGRVLKEKIVKAATFLPLVPKLNPDLYRPPIVAGPFDIRDKEGVLLVPDQAWNTALDRLHFRGARKRGAPPTPVPPPPGMRRPTPPPSPGSPKR